MTTIQILFLVLLAIFYCAYLTKMFLQKRRGIQTDQLGKGKSDKSRFWVEIFTKTATYTTVAAEVISIIIYTGTCVLWQQIFGLILTASGVTIFITAMVTMRDSWRAGIGEKEKTSFVHHGIYRLSRNPAFLGFDLTYIGILVVFFNWVLLAISLWAIVMFHLLILQEEQFLPTIFGEEYLLYKKQVNRYLGFSFPKDESGK